MWLLLVMVVLGVFCFETISHYETLACNSRDLPAGLNVCAPDPCLFSNYLRDWKDGSTVKSTGWSSSGSGFNYQNHLLDSQPPITPVPGNPMPYGLCGAPGTCVRHRHTCKKTLIHLKVKIIFCVCICVSKLKRNLPCQGKKKFKFCVFFYLAIPLLSLSKLKKKKKRKDTHSNLANGSKRQDWWYTQ